MSSLERPPDEAVNFLTHGLGLVLSLAGAVFLMRLAMCRAVTLINSWPAAFTA